MVGEINIFLCSTYKTFFNEVFFKFQISKLKLFDLKHLQNLKLTKILIASVSPKWIVTCNTLGLSFLLMVRSFLIKVTKCSKTYIRNLNIFFQNTSNPSTGNQTTILREDYSHVANNEEAVTAEIAATARSLKTNLVLSFVFIFILFLLANFSETLTVLIISTLKGLVPILTTIANFGKIQNVLALYWQNLVCHLRECFKCARFSHAIN